jgi:hypothetical protein
MTCAYVYPIDASTHHLEFAAEPDDIVPVTELPLVEEVEQNLGAERVEAEYGGEAAFRLDDAQLSDVSLFLRDMCTVMPVPNPHEQDFMHGQDGEHYFSPFGRS